MARDVVVDVTANDKTGPGLASAEASFKRTGDNITKEYDQVGKKLGNKLLKSVGMVSPSLARAIAGSIGEGATLGQPLLIAGLSSAAPVISGLMGAAVMGGAAGLGIVGGAVLASRDARVQTAGKAMAANLLSSLESRSSVFVGPMLESIRVVENKFRESGDTIESIFKNSSRFVVPLTDAVTDALQDVAEGVDTAIGRSGPVMRSFNDGFRGMGSTVKGFFEDMSSDAEASARILDSAFSSINGTIEITGKALSAVNSAFGWLDQNVMRLSIWDQIPEAFDKVDQGARRTGSGTFELADGFRGMGESAEDAEKKLRAITIELDKQWKALLAVLNAQRDLFDDTTKLGKAEDDLAAARRKNGQTLDANTEKGRANRDALSNLANALSNYRRNLSISGAGIEKITKVTRDQIVQFYNAARAMGAGRDKAVAYTSALLQVPKDLVTNVVIHGMAGAVETARRIKLTLASIRDETVNVYYKSIGLSSAAARAAAAKNSARFAASDYWSGVDNASAGMARTGGPVSVTSTVENVITLDGAPFRAYTARAVSDSERRQAWRQRVGGRY